MATMLETPSRIWRRIEAIEEQDMPSLPSLPPFEDSTGEDELQNVEMNEESGHNMDTLSTRIHSTPASTTHHNITSTFRAPGSSSSAARFAQSIESRSNRSLTGPLSVRGMSSRRSHHDSFEVPSLPHIELAAATGHYSDETDEDMESRSSVSEVYLPPEEDESPDGGDRDFSLTDALESVSRSGSPPFLPHVSREDTPKKGQEFSFSATSESKPSPFEKYRNVALRRTNPRARTPSLSRTSSSPTTSPTQSTPRSNRSLVLPPSNAPSPILAARVPLPRSRTASPAVMVHNPQGAEEEQSISEQTFSNDTHETRSMDITDVHISPPRLNDDEQDGDILTETESHEQSQHHEQQSHTTHDDREPTFSSEGDATPYAINTNAATQNASTFSSLSQSIAFTPTPAFPRPRPRARFDLPPPPSDVLATPAPRVEAETTQQPDDDVLATPFNKRPSFLLSVINSTARPRMTAGTPHPRRFAAPSVAESTPAPISAETTSAPNLQSALAGVTPRPRIAIARRSSHPTTSASSGSRPSISPGNARPAMWATPAHSSPYDGAGDRASFISTASSHDLTTHQRANTSFDPAMGFGAGALGHGVGRFNAGKLNTYLHGLNRRLQEENEALVERLRRLEEEKNGGQPGDKSSADSDRRLSGGRRRSSVGTTLGNVQEDMAEAWLEEKAELEEVIEAFRTEATTYMAEKEEAENALQQEKDEREKDKVQWRERMAEVERGVSGIVTGLEEKLVAAEKETKRIEQEATRQLKEMERAAVSLEGERDVAMDRASKAERLLENGKDLGGALKEANERVAQVMADLRNANAQIKQLGDQVMEYDSRIDELEAAQKEDAAIISDLEHELAAASDALADERVRVRDLGGSVRKLNEDLANTKEYVQELESDAAIADQQMGELKKDMDAAQETIKMMSITKQQNSQDIEALEREAEEAQERVRDMQTALEEAERQSANDQEVLAHLRAKVASLERERERSRDISAPPVQVGPSEAEYDALENEFNDAEKEIARLNALLNQSPARKAIDMAKDIKIEMLEREKEELLERNRALRMTFNEFSTPNKIINSSGISPIHRQVLSMSIRAPKTPGAPLKDLSWLNSIHDPSVSPLVSEIGRLQQELDRANESIDDKLDKLEDAGLGVVGLTKMLEDARAKIILLEDEIARLNRREERKIRRLARARCQKCNIKLDLRSLTQADESSFDIPKDNLPNEPPTPPTRTSEALKANIQAVNNHLEQLKKQWEHEKEKLMGEKAVLENAANRLNGQVKSSQEQARKVAESSRAVDKAKANAQNVGNILTVSLNGLTAIDFQELEKAKQTILVLENELTSERSRLRALVAEQERKEREKKQILVDMQRAESDMDLVKEEFQKAKKENASLEKELRENANAEQKARHLEVRVAEKLETIERLRQERSLLAADYKELQQRFTAVSETANKLRKEYAAHSTSHDNRRHELDLHRLEIDELRRALDDRAGDLQRAEQEKEKVLSEKHNVVRTVAALEADLKRVRRDAEAFGRDLKLLRAEKEKLEAKSKEELSKAERAKKQAQTQIRLLNEQLEMQKDETAKASEQTKRHVCAADETQVSELKLQHNKECKGLIIQIRYLKAKFTRESTFRNDLTYQKQYLLILLAQFEKSERTIFASIARIGFPVAPPPLRRVPKLKSVVLTAVFFLRVR
ncbi:unnamed protein product [Cyclocybe aegerita]|uniref:Pericentrin/AKAP-450 centrosomal targeting domain-containing protein n=1 Tax=Cyclocybe aegerita TaxID=1973307 RepID=A0A8S0XZ32_CYCAE|nr:unnamed protein product [Cyclocybe aegerita]